MAFQRIDWTDQVIEEFWRYWQERPDTYFADALGATVVRFANDRLGGLGTALDFGAGSGGLLAALSSAGTRCYGVEFGTGAIDRLGRRFADARLVEGVMAVDDLDDFGGFFDTVFLIETIEHLPDRHLDPAVGRILSVLKPGGWLVVSTPNDEDLEAAEVYCPVSRIAFHPMQHLRSWNTDNLSAFLKRAGFADVACLETDLQALPYHSRAEMAKRLFKRAFYRGYKDPHLVAFARKPG